MTELPDVRALVALPFEEQKDITGITNLGIPKRAQKRFDQMGLWWAAPFAQGATGSYYAFRLTPGPGHGSVLRCVDGHAVTIASSPDRAILAMLAVERLLRGEKSRAKLHAGWSKANKVLRQAVELTGGSPNALDEMLHVADDLPQWTDETPPKQMKKVRAMLRHITGEPKAESAAWSRAEASIDGPDDANASLLLLQGNHGLDGTHLMGGLLPGSAEARELLVASAKQVEKSKMKSDPAWAEVIASIAKKGQPTPDNFIDAVGGKSTQASWEALAATSFWFNAVKEEVPDDQIELAEEIAGDIAKPILKARHALDK